MEPYAERERSIVFEADSQGVHYKGKNASEKELIEEKAQAIWATASHLHFNRDFRFNSQSTSMQFTERLTIGGRAWLSIKCKNENEERALALWGNTTLGILLYWWHCNKQQAGRGSIAKLLLDSMSVLDVRTFTPKQNLMVGAIFKKVATADLKPVHEIAEDATRHALDEAFLGDVLALPKSMFGKHGLLQLVREEPRASPRYEGTRTVRFHNALEQETSQRSCVGFRRSWSWLTLQKRNTLTIFASSSMV